MIATKQTHRCPHCRYHVNLAQLPDGSRVCGMCSQPITPTRKKTP